MSSATRATPTPTPGSTRRRGCGHGGHDSGAIGGGGLREKDVVLSVALMVGQYLEELLDLKVVYTRKDDRFITLRNRGKIANEAGGKLFISIHANAARNVLLAQAVVIDAGHGGHDSGAIGGGGLREKDVVLSVALMVGQYLEELLDLKVVYTRKDDRFITLRNRGKIANEAGGKLFISIHANAARNRTGHGTETYFLGMHKTDAAQHVMERENSVIRYESDPNAYAGLNQAALIEQTLAQSAYMRGSEHLAGLVQQQFTQRVGRVDRGVKQAGFYVLWGASMPAILVELGFVTNAQEAAYLKSENGQIYLASAIFRAVREFKAEYEKGLDLVIRP